MNQVSRRGSLLVIFLTVFIDLLGFGLVLPLLPIYAKQFSVDAGGWVLGALMASFSAMQFLCAPLWGRLSDRIGRRPVLIIGLGGSVVFYSLFGVATILASLPLLFVSRIGAGAAGATISTAQAYIADTTPLEGRAKGMALVGMAFGMGFTLGPLLGYLAVPSGHGEPGPAPGFVAAGLSLGAVLLALFKLPESLTPESRSAARRVLDPKAIRAAVAVPSIAAILGTIFVCVFSFAMFETTLSLLIWGDEGKNAAAPFRFTWGQVCLTYAYIGLVLAVIQGGVVRRIAGRVSEAVLAASGAAAQVVGFFLVTLTVEQQSVGLLLVSLAIIVSGFGFLMPSLNSLLSRRSNPRDQGAVLGLAQSVNSLARIVGAAVGIPMLNRLINLPYYAAAVLMGIGLLMVLYAAMSGRDYGEESRDTQDPSRETLEGEAVAEPPLS